MNFMADRLKHRILSHLTDRRYEPQQIQELAEDLGIGADAFPAFRVSVDELISEGQVALGSSASIILPPPGPEMIGTFRLARGGFGFVIPETPMQHGDLFVPPPNTGGALTGDLVRAAVMPQGRGGGSRHIGRIVEILQRSDRHYVGNLIRQGAQWLVRVDGKRFHDPVVVRDPHAKNATEGDKVVIEILEYPAERTLAEGVITEVLGPRGRPDIETIAVMRAHGLPDQFSSAVLREARASARHFDEDTWPADRQDLRDLEVVTIDPPDAKDFDDAISVQRLDPNGQGHAYELGVHIADVSHFIPPGESLDEEARTRGNSAYLPRRVVPMLPELLSNGVCSLQEKVNRYCKSVFIQYNADGKVCGQRFVRGVIRSRKRLTYREAQALIEGDVQEAYKQAVTTTAYPEGLLDQLELMDELARVIRRRRMRAGMIVLDLPEVELIFNKEGQVIDAEPEDDSFTHTIIEMFMVEANEAAARLFDTMNVPMIRRIHADPPVHDLKELRQFARVAGHNIPANPTRVELQGLLDAVRDKPEQHAVHLAVLKTLSRAEYAPLHIGHFALASEHYTHFTSPIRRYPDLVVHRGLDVYLDQSVPKQGRSRSLRRLGRAVVEDPRVGDETEMKEIAAHCSRTERNAEAAERDLREYLMLELLGQHLGDDFDGIVTGVTGTGIFVQIDRYLVDGFVHITNLPGGEGRGSDPWRLNRKTGALVAERSGRTVAIGDRFVVRIARVNPEGRQLDLVIVETGKKPRNGRSKKAKRRQARGAARSHQNAKRLKQVRKRERRSR